MTTLKPVIRVASVAIAAAFILIGLYFLYTSYTTSVGTILVTRDTEMAIALMIGSLAVLKAGEMLSA